MAYALTEFDGLTLPAYKELGQSDDLGTGLALTSYARMPGGGFYDNYGSGDSPDGQDPIVKESRLIETSAANLLTSLDALRAKKRKRGILKATFHDGTVRWLYARMTEIDHPALRGNLQSLDVRMAFVPEGGVWFAESQTSYNGTLTAKTGTPQDVNVSNGGNVNVVDMTITVTAGTTTITDITVENTTTGQSVQYTATIATTKALVIDVGALSIQNDGSNGYGDATISDKADWLRLDTGSNTIRFTVTGNTAEDATYTITYYDHYA